MNISVLAICTSGMLICAQTAAATSPTVSDVAAMKKEMERGRFQGRAAWIALGHYLQGAMESLGMMQQTLEKRGDKGAFCPPPGTAFSMQDVFKSLEKSESKDGDTLALEAILADLQRQYPCAP